MTEAPTYETKSKAMNHLPLSLHGAIVAEIGTEKILWSGTPDPWSLAQREWAQAVVGTLAACFFGLWMGLLLRAFAQRGDPKLIAFLALGATFFVFALVRMFAPLFAARRARRMAYVLTERRALVFEQSRGVRISTFGLAQVTLFERESIDGVAVDLVFQRITKRRRRGTEIIAFGFLGLKDSSAAETALRDLVARHRRPEIGQKKSGP